MRRWIIAVVTTLTVAGVLVVARARSESSDPVALADRDPQVAAARALLRARNDSLQAWTLAHQRAIVLAAVATLRPSSAPFALETRGAVDAGTREAYAAVFAAELRDLGTPRVPIRVVLIADSARRSDFFAPWYIRPTRAGEPCIIALRVRRRANPAYSADGLQRLGPCGLYAVAGLPGPGIARWLDSTRAGSALSYRPPPVREPLDRNRYLAAYQVLGRLAPIACAAGRDEACVEALLDPLANRRQLPAVGPADASGLVQRSSFELDDFPGVVTAAIRQSLGDERFAQWWASDLPPADAYERVSGVRFATFAQRYLRPYLGRKSSGPLTAGLPLALGMLLAVGLAYWAIRATPRARS